MIIVVICLVVMGALSLVWPHLLSAHSSGTPHLADSAAGPYRIWVWSWPEPLRAGEAHISVAVAQPNRADAANLPTTEDLAVEIRFTPLEQPEKQFSQGTAKQRRLFEEYYESDFLLPLAGPWEANVVITGPEGNGMAHFPFIVLPPHRMNWEIVGWGTLMLAALIGFAWVRRGVKT
ncbi:MAG: hypothetical protein R3C14_24165 [Caldilineaceae bacterium]